MLELLLLVTKDPGAEVETLKPLIEGIVFTSVPACVCNSEVSTFRLTRTCNDKGSVVKPIAPSTIWLANECDVSGAWLPRDNGTSFLWR